MIARLKGMIDGIYLDNLILDVGGVGYKVFASTKTLHSVRLGDMIALDIETIIREDAFNLFGFLSTGDKQWFEILTSVQGVGAKAALAIQSLMSVQDLYVAIGAGDAAAFGRANGVGPKLAGRIVLELKDKVSKISMGSQHVQESANTIVPKANRVKTDTDTPSNIQGKSAINNSVVMEDTLSALTNLGFSRSHAFSAIGKVMENMEGDISVEKIIPLALKDLNG